MACKLTYNGKQYNSEIALRLDVLKDRNLLEDYNLMFEEYTTDSDYTFEQNRQALLDILPDDLFNITDKNNILDRVINNGITLGYFHNKTIYLASNAPIGTAYHEAFHAVFRTLLSDEQVTNYLDKAKKQYGKPTKQQLNEVRELSSSYGNLTDIQLEHIYYEERMAEDFREYMEGKKPKTLFGRLFAKLKKIIEYFNQPHTIEGLFEDISLGKYKTGKPVHSIFRKSPVFSLSTVRNKVKTKLTATDVQQIFSKVALLAAKDKKYKLTDEDVRGYLNTVKQQFKVGNWTEELSRLDSLKAKELKERLSAIYNAISEDTQFEQLGDRTLETTIEKPEWFDANVKYVKQKANSMLQGFIEEDEDLDPEDSQTQLRSESRETKGSIAKMNEFVRNYIRSIEIPRDYFNLGINLNDPNIDDKHIFTVDYLVVFNSLRKNLTDKPKDKILNIILTNRDSLQHVTPFRNKLIDDIIVDLARAGINLTRKDVIEKSADPVFINTLFENSKVFNSIVAAFHQSRDTYLTALNDRGNVSVLSSNIASSADKTLFKWRQNTQRKNLTALEAQNIVAGLSNYFNYTTVKSAFIEDKLHGKQDFNDIVEKAYQAYNALGISLSKTYISDELLKVFIEGYKNEKGIKGNLNTIAALKNIVSDNLLNEFRSRASKGGVINAKGFKRLRLMDANLKDPNNFNYNLLSALRTLPESARNPIATIIDNNTAPVKNLAFINMQFDETFTNESIVVGGKSIFAINPPHFLSELHQTLSSIEMQDVIEYIKTGELSKAKEIFDTLFGADSKYKYNQFIVDRLWNAYSNSIFIKGINVLDQSNQNNINKLLEITLQQMSNFVLYDIGTTSDMSLEDVDKVTNMPNEEYSKASKAQKIFTKLGLFDNKDTFRQFIPQVLSDKTTNRTVEFPVFTNLNNQELKQIYFLSLKNNLRIEYNKIQQNIEYHNNLPNRIGQDFTLLRNYNYIEVDGVSYMPVFKDGKFDGFRKLVKEYDEYGIYQGATLEAANINKNLDDLRGFSLFNFKGSKYVQDARRGVDFDTLNIDLEDTHTKMMNELVDMIPADETTIEIIYDKNC